MYISIVSRNTLLVKYGDCGRGVVTLQRGGFFPDIMNNNYHARSTN